MALAGSAATTLVGLMVSDSWTHTKDRFARLFARGGAEDEMAETLDTARAELVVARATGDALREAESKPSGTTGSASSCEATRSWQRNCGA